LAIPKQLAKNKWLINFFQFVNCWPGEKIVKIKGLNCFLVDNQYGSRSTNAYVWNWPHVKALFRKILNTLSLKSIQKKERKNKYQNGVMMYTVKVVDLNYLCDCGRPAEYWNGCEDYACGKCVEKYTKQIQKEKGSDTTTW